MSRKFERRAVMLSRARSRVPTPPDSPTSHRASAPKLSRRAPIESGRVHEHTLRCEVHRCEVGPAEVIEVLLVIRHVHGSRGRHISEH